MADTKPTPRAGRKRGIPPAPPQRTAFGALANSNDALALALYAGLKNVLIWACTPPNRRPALFRRVGNLVRERAAAAADAAPALGDLLPVFVELQSSPGTVEPANVAVACHRVWEWAERRGLLAVATHYAEAAAYAEPTNPTWAVIAGYMTRKTGGLEMWARSGVWYARALALAVRENNRAEVVRALSGTGALLKEMDQPDEALVYYEKAAKRAKRLSHRAAAVVQHYIFALLVDCGQLERAVPHAVQAFDLYQLKDERLPYLAHDLGYLLIRMRYFRLALHALDAAPAHGFFPHYLGVVYATTAQAAGGAGRVARYEAAARASLQLVDASEEYAAAALASLGEGARSLGRWELAERHARASLRIARSRHDREAAREAVALVRAILRREPGPSMETPPADAPVAMLTRRIAARLRPTRHRGTRV